MNRYTQTAADLDHIHKPRACRDELILDLSLVAALVASLVALFVMGGS